MMAVSRAEAKTVQWSTVERKLVGGRVICTFIEWNRSTGMYVTAITSRMQKRGGDTSVLAANLGNYV